MTLTQSDDVSTRIFAHGNNTRILVEIDGAGEKDIRLDLNGDRLYLFAAGEDRGYRKEIGLPHVYGDMVWKALGNGVFEIVLSRTEPPCNSSEVPPEVVE